MLSRTCLLAVGLIVPSGAYGFDYRSEGFSIDDVSQIEVRIWDDASEGCWTSIRSSKAYLGDKLDLTGVSVVEESAYRAMIQVKSSRTPARFLGRFGGWREGICFGSVAIYLYKKELPLDKNNPMNIYISTDTTFTGYPNANELVFEMIDKFISDIK